MMSYVSRAKAKRGVFHKLKNLALRGKLILTKYLSTVTVTKSNVNHGDKMCNLNEALHIINKYIHGENRETSIKFEWLGIRHTINVQSMLYFKDVLHSFEPIIYKPIILLSSFNL